jgi:hypothetical protein
MATNAVPLTVSAVVTKLRAASGVSALVGTRVHKALPRSPVYPCVSVFVPTDLSWDTKDADGVEITLQVDCWTRDDRDQDSVRALQKAVRDALHDQSLTLTGENHVLTRLVSEFAFPDEDGSTVHGVSNYKVLAHA